MTTTFSSTTLLICAAALVVAPACDDMPECDADPEERVEFRTSVDNSATVNGIYLNGIYLNGIYLNGIYLNSALLSGATIGGVDFLGGTDPDDNEVTCVELDDKKGKLSVISAEDGCDGDPSKDEEVKGDHVVGTVLTFSSPEGEYRLVIQAADEVNDYPHHYDHLHLYHYGIEYEVKGESGWTGETSPLCYDGAGNPTEALMLPGAWDHSTGTRTDTSNNTVTAACRHAALAKCAEWGYRPGEEADYHQACVRLVRADYDASGTARTANGTTIYVSDDLGINTEDDVPGLVKEAEWGPDGALCVNRANFRRSDLTGCSDPTDAAECLPGIPECTGPDSDLSLSMPGALIVTGVVNS